MARRKIAPALLEPIEHPQVDVAEVVAALPEHSHLGASSAERWMNCPGSVNLIAAVKADAGHEEEDPDYRRDGTQAHALAAHCLEGEIDCWEADHEQFPELTTDMMSAVQTYLDHIRSLPGEAFVELRLHRPEFHPAAFGTLDCVKVSRVIGNPIRFRDYKHGVGIVVEVVGNVQLMYYAYLYIHEDPEFGDDEQVELGIVQPRGFHHDGPIRTWLTTVGEIRRWAREELRPAMEATADLEYLDMGEWCRFCPAKLFCPAMNALAKKALNVEITYPEAQQIKMLIKAREDAAFKRLMAGELEPGAKLVNKRVDRVFKSTAPVEGTFGDDAWEPRKLRSPAQIEGLPQGKDFVAEWAFKPAAGYSVALETDARQAVIPATPQTTEEKFGVAAE